MQTILNRLKKNYKRMKGLLKDQKIEAYRLYDRDIPEYPFIVDVYGEHYIVYDRSNDEFERDQEHLELTLAAIKTLEPKEVVIKKRKKQKSTKQYEKLATKNETIIINEGPAKFIINLHDYLDTGLFLDHRPLRKIIFKSAEGKKVLNLFSYTSSLSVMAALAGAKTTSVDMSSTYLEWSKENFKLNGLDIEKHEFIKADIISSLQEVAYEKYDIIVLDPPTFSNSKKMKEHFDVDSSQVFLVDECMRRLKLDGILYFSNNKRDFKLSEYIYEKYKIEDISKETIPFDFHDKKIHQCYKISFLKEVIIFGNLDNNKSLFGPI